MSALMSRVQLKNVFRFACTELVMTEVETRADYESHMLTSRRTVKCLNEQNSLNAAYE